MKQLLALCACGLLVGTTASAQTVLDFETEDDFATVLVNGQIVDPNFDPVDLEFGNLVDITSTNLGAGGHLGATIFDSSPTGPNQFGGDPDLLIDSGNILLLQNSTLPGTTLDPTYGLLYNTPDDEQDLADAGSILISFLSPVQLLSVDLIDANGGFGSDVTLTDSLGRTRVYTVPAMWSGDIAACGGLCNGFETLDLTSELPQDGEGAGGSTVVVTDPLFNPLDVISLDIAFTGNPGSGAIDNVTFIPEPTTAVLLGLGLFGLGLKRRQAH